MDDIETKNRRARLRELISECFGNNQQDLLSHIKQRGYNHNQGEMSALKKINSTKSFADGKAKTLTEMIGLHRRWFDFPVGTNIKREEWMLPYIEGSSSPEPSASYSASSATPITRKKSAREKKIEQIVELLHKTSETGINVVLDSAKSSADRFPLISKLQASGQ